MLTNIPNAQKPFVCGYTSLFSIIAIQNDLRADENADLTPRQRDYCTNLKGGVEQKIDLIDSLNLADTISTTYYDDCVALFSNDKLVNWWFDPLIPSESITVGEMCIAYQDMFGELHKVQYPTSQNDAVAYSYVLTYQMYLDEMKLDVYNGCIDDELLQQPTQYCDQVLSAEIEFALWNDVNEQSSCAEGVNGLEEICEIESTTQTYVSDENGDLQEDETTGGSTPDECKPCAYVIAYIFERYEHYVATTMQAAFEAIADDQAQTLQAATYTAAGIDPVSLNLDEPASQPIPVTEPTSTYD